ncbi:MAG: restriction endonuclease subunit S [Candidatus Enterosoma sp.]|nr:restriction endonuclease subunit S [Candidatus Enterosoma sp.]
MALNRVRFGDYIKLIKEKCGVPNLTPDDVSGINRDKEFFEPSKQVGGDTSNYKIVPPNCFACNIMHVGRDVVLPIALNTTNKNKIVSPAYTIFEWTGDKVLLKEFLFMMLKSSEKDRYFWFHCDSSVRDGMDWDAFCDIELEVPSIEIQKKYVAIYEGMLANLRSYEKGLENLKLVCDGYIEDLRKKYPLIEISQFIKQRTEANDKLAFKLNDVVGVSAEKKIIPTKADASKNDISKFVLVKPNDFIYNPRNGIAVALNDSNSIKIISWNNTCFYIENKWLVKINPKFLYMFLCRSEWNRKTKFLSWGSSTEVFSFDAMGETKIPLAPIEMQNRIIQVLERRESCMRFIEKEKELISKMCPILVRGSILEAQGGILYV